MGPRVQGLGFVGFLRFLGVLGLLGLIGFIGFIGLIGLIRVFLGFIGSVGLKVSCWSSAWTLGSFPCIFGGSFFMISLDEVL